MARIGSYARMAQTALVCHRGKRAGRELDRWDIGITIIIVFFKRKKGAVSRFDRSIDRLICTLNAINNFLSVLFLASSPEMDGWMNE